MNPNIDDEEVAYFERLADTWWDRDGPFWPLHRLNELRSTFIADSLESHFKLDTRQPAPLRGLRVLDVGCGGGILAESIARLGAEVHGIDVVERNIQVARRHAARSGLQIRYEALPVEALVARREHYDAVLNMEVVEHVSDLGRFMEACNALVGQHGMMFVATINRTVMSWLFAIVGAEYVLGWLPRGTHRWRKFPKPSELRALLERGGIAVTEQRGVFVNPLTRRFRLSRLTPVNYMLSCVRPRASDASLPFSVSNAA